ncbi:MAG: hypothetical protein QNK18_15770, partial [Gammaproteobacteria bacterium]|nr:hypothetical protein [Gammaproteobacteria bacterium]
LVEVDEAQLERAVVALRVEGVNAIRPIEGLLPILYPGVRLSYGRDRSSAPAFLRRYRPLVAIK